MLKSLPEGEQLSVSLAFVPQVVFLDKKIIKES
jgi:hypothetical protein